MNVHRRDRDRVSSQDLTEENWSGVSAVPTKKEISTPVVWVICSACTGAETNLDNLESVIASEILDR